MSNNLPAILLMGPTASGKTAIAVELAQRYPLDLISVDSALVYRDMDIGTAKPDRQTLAAAPHALIDIISPEESYSAARFVDDATRLIESSHARGRIPLLVGGTMLYFKALREGLADLPDADPAVRATLQARAGQEGWPALHAELARHDPRTAARLHPTDSQRVERALEVFLLSGLPLSELLDRQRQSRPSVDFLPIALVPSDRAVLHDRIERRFEQMLGMGLIEEVERLRADYRLDPAMPSMRCVGYRQTWDYLDGLYGREELLNRGIYATRQLAKRQLTWLRGMNDLIEVDCLDPAAPRVVERHIAAARP